MKRSKPAPLDGVGYRARKMVLSVGGDCIVTVQQVVLVKDVDGKPRDPPAFTHDPVILGELFSFVPRSDKSDGGDGPVVRRADPVVLRDEIIPEVDIRMHSLLDNLSEVSDMGEIDKSALCALAGALTGVASDSRARSLFDCPNSYRDFFPVLLATMGVPPSRYLSVLDKGNGSTSRRRDRLECMIRSSIGSNLVNDLSVAEIGGSVGARFLRALGADTYHVDAGYDEDCVKNDLLCPVKDRGGLVDLGHYKHKLPGQYNLTLSNNMFDEGSGIEAIVSSFKDASMRLLAVFSNITKDKGLSVHGGFCVDLPDQFYEYLGMRCVHKSGKRFYNPLTVFEKRDPAPWLYPDGVRCGHDRIVYDGAVGEFCLSKQAASGGYR